MNIHTVIPSLSRDQFRWLSFRETERILRLRSASLRLTGFLSLLFVINSPLPAESSATLTSHPDLLAEALPVLRTKYVNFKALQFKEGDRLSDLITRSDGKISISEPATVSTPIISAFLPGNIIYWRLASFTPETTWTNLGAQLDQWVRQGTEGIILDLRSNTAPNDYAGAALVANFFTPNHTPLFSFVPERGPVDSGQVFRSTAADPLFHQPVILITNHQTSGAAEALAACLKSQGALMVGQTTHGKAADFAEQKLSTGQVLQFAVAQVHLADGANLWNHPVNPDISLRINEQVEKTALDLIGRQGILEVIHETTERRRMSEAALVQGDDPEWDDYLVAHEKKPETHPATISPVQDVALINALDSLKAIRVSQRNTTSVSGGEVAPESSLSVQ